MSSRGCCRAEQLALLPVTLEIVAGAPERAALAARFALAELVALTARLTVEDGRKPGRVVVKGRLEAEVVQTCVVSLAPVPGRLSECFEERFITAGDDTSAAAIGTDLDEDPPEPLPAEGIDLGELVAQRLALALDPYPRSADAQLAAEWGTAKEEEAERHSPFAALKGMAGKS